MQQYLDLLREVLDAPVRGDRTGTGTHSVFGRSMRFSNVAKAFPLVTTKKVWFYGVFHELKWMLAGDTNIRYLLDHNVSIWTDWPLKYYNQQHPEDLLSKEEFELRIKNDDKFARTWGDCGPVYGYQWRYWRRNMSFIHHGEKQGMNIYLVTGDDEEYVDQIDTIIEQLYTNPEDRRIILNAWNVGDIEAMTVSGLPPCHMMAQFYTRPVAPNTRDLPPNEELRYLDCQVYIRSNDLFLGAPFNIAQYALLMHLLAHTVGMIPGDLVYTIGDAHIYLNHVDQVREQLTRTPGILPTLQITKTYNDPKLYNWEDLKLIGYNSQAIITGKIAV